MSVHVSSWVWNHSITTGTDRLLMLALADMANDEGVCWPGVKALAKRCRCTERTIQSCTAKAVEIGELAVVRRFKENGHPSSNVYQFTAFSLPGDGEIFSPYGEATAGGMVNVASPSLDPSSDPSLFSLSDKAKPENEQEVVTFCLSIGLKQVDGEYFWNHWLSNGFTVGGKKFKNWKAVIRAWTANGHSPSQKPHQNWSTTNGWEPKPRRCIPSL